MRVAIYARFSSNAQREASIEEQVKVCREFAAKNDYTVVEVYHDNAISGKTDDRPALQRLLSDSGKHYFNGVLVYSIDRFGRDLIQSLSNEQILRKNNVSLLSATENFSDDPSGRFFRNIMMSYAQYYSDELSAKIIRGKNYNVERCLYNGGSVPLGYKIGKDKHFEIDSDTAPIVRKIFEMYADGKTVTEITAFLNARGLKTSKGVSFNKNSLHTILKNERYLGYYIQKDKKIKDGVPRIISDELFNEVASIMEKNKKAPARSKAKALYLLTTKLFCGYCKNMMTGFSGTGKQGKLYHYYICNGRKEKNCTKKMVDKDYIENLVVENCRQLLTTENIHRIAKEVVAIYEAEKDDSNLKQLKKSMENNERRHQNAILAIMESDDKNVRKTLSAQIPILEEEHREIEKQIAIEEKSFPTITESHIRFFLTSLKKGKVDDEKYRKTLIDVFVNQIFLYDDKITIIFNSGDRPVTVPDKLLSKLESENDQNRVLFLNGSAPYFKESRMRTVSVCGTNEQNVGKP